MAIVHTSQIDAYVEAVCAANGDFFHPSVAELYQPLELAYETSVDDSLSPYSDEYFSQQMALYAEIAGRPLDQATGELHPENIEPLKHAANPAGNREVADMAEHVRSIATMLGLACLEGKARALDMGAGYGISSEALAFTGCSVHAVDIDPLLGELARHRAAARSLDITRIDANFDDISVLEDDSYDCAFFFQSLHHCLKPWNLIASLRSKLKPDAVIAFTGEPINTRWWRHWGIRLDCESVFAARRLGWFEAGWSPAFINECFERSGFHFAFFNGGNGGGLIGVAATSEERLQKSRRKAGSFGLAEQKFGTDVSASAWNSVGGERCSLFGQQGFRQYDLNGRTLLYGPYVSLDAGKYEMSLILARDGDDVNDLVELDIIAGIGAKTLHREALGASDIGAHRLIVRHFVLDQMEDNIEIRCQILEGQRWSVTLPSLRLL